MKIDEKIIDTRRFLMENETQLQNEILELVDDMNNANELSHKRYEQLREEANDDYDNEQAHLYSLIREAGVQVKSIKNKLFRKYYNAYKSETNVPTIAGKVYESASMVYDKLLYEIEIFKHDRNRTPFQRFLGKIISIFKPSYRRDEVKKILMIYATLIDFQNKNDRQEALTRKIARIDEEEASSKAARRNAVNEHIEDKINTYKKLLEEKLLLI